MNYPSILVTDTNIWIDLNHGGIIPEIFQLPYQFITSDFSLHEYISLNWNDLQLMGLEICELDSENMKKLESLRQQFARLSIIDLSALLLAEERNATLLTGDKPLRELAEILKVKCHGLLWILDEIILYGLITPQHAAKSLKIMLTMGARLPSTECDRRIRKWEN